MATAKFSDFTAVLGSLTVLPGGFFAHIAATGSEIKVTFGTSDPKSNHALIGSYSGPSLGDAMEKALANLMIEIQK